MWKGIMMSEPEVIAVGTTCPVCGETFYAPEPKYSELIQQLVRVARAASEVRVDWGHPIRWTDWNRLKEALDALPEGMLDDQTT